jgi:hypothetical protein
VSRQRTAPDGSVAGNGRDTELVDGASDVVAVASIRIGEVEQAPPTCRQGTGTRHPLRPPPLLMDTALASDSGARDVGSLPGTPRVVDPVKRMAPAGEARH